MSIELSGLKETYYKPSRINNRAFRYRCMICIPNLILKFLYLPLAVSLDWDVENIAIFMKECGDTMCCEVLGNKAINGRVSELSYILYYLWQV